MILVDSNIPMYLTGAPHPLKTDARLLLERSIAAGERIVTDAEVLQEILHRYTAIQRRDAIAPTLAALLDFADEVYPIDPADVLRAAAIVQDPAGMSARDALHLAVMERHKIDRILSFDKDFDRWPGITRVFSV